MLTFCHFQWLFSTFCLPIRIYRIIGITWLQNHLYRWVFRCVRSLALGQTCSEVEAAPIRRPRLWATREVRTPKDRKRKNRTASGGWAVIQYTTLQYTTGNITCAHRGNHRVRKQGAHEHINKKETSLSQHQHYMLHIKMFTWKGISAMVLAK